MHYQRKKRKTFFWKGYIITGSSFDVKWKILNDKFHFIFNR